MTVAELVRAFLASPPFAVVGASSDPSKFGYRVLRKYLEHDLPVTPVNPKGGRIEGLAVARTLADVEPRPGAISVITPPDVTTGVVRDAIELGIRHIWLQPGAESDEAVRLAAAADVSLLHGGPCVLVELG